MVKSITKKSFSFMAIILLIAMSFSFVSPVLAQTSALGTLADQATSCNVFTDIMGCINGIGLTIVNGLGWAIGMATVLFTFIITLSDFTGAEAVQIGWTLVRDLANLFFVLIVLAIAIGTILRVESYNLKKALPRVVLMAVAVNFSLLIFGFIVDFGQVIMMAFVNTYANALESGALVKALQLDAITTADENALGDAVDDWQLFLNIGFAIIMLLIAFFVILTMFLVLLVRTVMLWLLAVLSPLPYLLSSFPQGQKYSQMWWTEFIKYVIVGPAFAFFLWLSLAVVTGTDSNGEIFGYDSTNDVLTRLEQNRKPSDDLFTAGSSFNSMITFIISIGMLLGGLVLTQKAGVAGGNLAGGAIGKIRGAGKLLAKTPLQYGGRKLNEKIGEGRISPLANPLAMYRGFQERRQQLYGSAQVKSTAAAEEKIEGMFNRGAAMPRRTRAAYAEESEFAKDFAFMDKEEVAAQAVSLQKARPSAENRSKRRALIRAAAENGYLDDIMAHPEMRKEMVKVAKDTEKKANDNAANDPKAKALAENLKQTNLVERMDKGEFYGWDQLNMFLKEYVGTDDKGNADQDGLNTINSLEDIGAKVKHPEYAGHATYRSEEEGGNGEMEMETMYDQKGDDGKVERKAGWKRAVAEFNKWAGRQKLSVAPHGVMTLGTEGNGFDEFSQQIMTSAFAGQGGKMTEHSQNRMWTMLQGGSGDDMNWAEGETGRVAQIAKGEQESDRHYERRLAALAHMMNVAGDASRNQMWQKVGGDEMEITEKDGSESKGEGQYEIEIDGKKQKLTAKELQAAYSGSEKMGELFGSSQENVVSDSQPKEKKSVRENLDEVLANYSDNLGGVTPDDKSNKVSPTVKAEQNEKNKPQKVAEIAASELEVRAEGLAAEVADEESGKMGQVRFADSEALEGIDETLASLDRSIGKLAESDDTTKLANELNSFKTRIGEAKDNNAIVTSTDGDAAKLDAMVVLLRKIAKAQGKDNDPTTA